MTAGREREQPRRLVLAIDHLLGEQLARDAKGIRLDRGITRSLHERSSSCLHQVVKSSALSTQYVAASGLGAVRVWIDVSNSPQVPFFRPLIALLEARGHEVEVTTRDYAQTLELLRLHGIDTTSSGRRTAAQAPRERRARWPRGFRALRRLREDATVRPRALARLARAPARRALARHPLRVRVRLRVRARPARARLPRGDARRRPGGDPAGPARPARAHARARCAATRA